VCFPDAIATHNADQVFYFGSDVLRRHDYDASVLRGTPAAHYVFEHQAFSGIQVPTKRRVLARRPDGTSVPEPLIVTIDLTDVRFS
jgi:hypothetical protein